MGVFSQRSSAYAIGAATFSIPNTSHTWHRRCFPMPRYAEPSLRPALWGEKGVFSAGGCRWIRGLEA